MTAPSVSSGVLSGNFSIAELGGRFGVHDVPCPQCANWPGRNAAGRRRKVLRVWVEPDFVTYHCVRCGAKGFVHKPGARINPQRLARQKAEAAARDRHYAARQLGKARWLWRVAVPAGETIVERYLRSRGITIVPPTVRFLTAHKPGHHPAMIAPFGLPAADKPIAEDQIRGAHLTLVKCDGSGKAELDPNKLMVGPSAGTPIALAPVNNGLGLAITEGIEDGLTVHQETGLGVWAAGAAGRMSALADAVPSYIECVTIYRHEDDAGRRGAQELARALDQRGIEAFIEGLAG